MKSFFTKALSAASPKGAADADATAAVNGELLSKAEALLKQLRTGQGENFPLLNEATRYGEALAEVSSYGRTPECPRTLPSMAAFVQGQSVALLCDVWRHQQGGTKSIGLWGDAVQQVEGAVMKMPDGDMKAAWREQVTELQRELQMATARMLSDTEDPPSRCTTTAVF